MCGEAPRPPGAEVLRLVHPEAPATRPPGAARTDPDAWTLHLGLHPQASVAGSEPGALRLTQVDGAEIRLDWEQPALGRALAGTSRVRLPRASASSALARGIAAHGACCYTAPRGEQQRRRWRQQQRDALRHAPSARGARGDRVPPARLR